MVMGVVGWGQGVADNTRAGTSAPYCECGCGLVDGVGATLSHWEKQSSGHVGPTWFKSAVYCEWVYEES